MQRDTNSLGYQVMDHNECIGAIARWYAPSSRALSTEYRLPDGKIADVIAVSPVDVITIWEIKTRWRAFELVEAWQKYSRYCDRLWLVSLALAPAEWAAFSRVTGFTHPAGASGIMSYLGGQPHVYRWASHHVGDPALKHRMRQRLLYGAV